VHTTGSRRAFGLGVLVSTFLALTGCSPFYVMRAAYEQSKILCSEQKIAKVLDNPSTPDDLHSKLTRVLEAREFAASQIHLTPGDSYTSYAVIDRDVLTWIVMGARPDSFNFATWWFPIVGSVPYKGFFEREDAIAEGKSLEDQGYEVWIRGSSAFSTLGWFDDPVLSTMLQRGEVELVNTIIHESVHATIWIPGRVDFNESLANFVGTEGAVQFYQHRLLECAAEDDQCRDQNKKLLESAILSKEREYAVAAVIVELYQALDKLYRSAKTSAEKISQRQQIFDDHVAPLRKDYPDLMILKSPNNAEILQLKLYLTGLTEFSQLFERQGNSWPEFFSAMQAVREKVEQDGDINPFEELAG